MQRCAPVCSRPALLASPRPAREPPTSWSGGRGASIPQEDEAVRETIAAFEQKTGKQVELVQPAEDEIMKQAASALQAGTPPDFLFSARTNWAARWAYEDRLVDLEGVPRPGPGPVRCRHDRSLDPARRQDRPARPYALPMGRISNHLHVWNSLLERAGFTLADIPHEWEAVLVVLVRSSAARGAQGLGRDDIWAVGLPMSAAANRHRDRAVSV